MHLSGVRPSVRLSVCPRRQEISIDCCTAHSGGRMRAVPRCQRTQQLNTYSTCIISFISVGVFTQKLVLPTCIGSATNAAGPCFGMEKRRTSSSRRRQRRLASHSPGAQSHWRVVCTLPRQRTPITCRQPTRATEQCCRPSLTTTVRNYSGRASALGGIVNLVDRRRSSLSL